MALPTGPDPKEPQKASEPSEDNDFDPSPEVLIDEIDDERTLDEEEAIDGTNQAAVQEELNDLKRESEMPIEELLAYYERMRNQAASSQDESDEDEEDIDDEDDDDEDDDYSYTDDEDHQRDWRRSIHVGPDHQADIPEGLSEYGDLPPYQTEDKLIWKCNPDMRDEQIIAYLKDSSSTDEYFQNEEQLLYLLLQCNFDIDEALRRRRLNPYKYFFHEPMSLWSQDECLGFEHGLRTYGKDFRQIRENKVKTRTHAELVAFYYLWKKSERHDVYTNQYKLDRKRCLTHPGTTDYMDEFIEDNESALNASSPSPTPTSTESTVGTNLNIDAISDGGLATPSC